MNLHLVKICSLTSINKVQINSLGIDDIPSLRNLKEISKIAFVNLESQIKVQ